MTKQRITVERYFAVINPKSIRATILPSNAEPRESYDGELKEISPTGAILLLGAPPEFKGECQLSLVSHKLDESLIVTARLNWLRPNPVGEWQLGCTIEPHLSEQAFCKLLSSGLLERRSTRRESAHIPVQVQLAPANPRIPALIRNISEGGLCCLATACPPEGTRHVCMFASVGRREVRIPIKVRWSTRAGTEYFIGCQFVRQTDFAVLRQLQSEQEKACDVATQPSFLSVGVGFSG